MIKKKKLDRISVILADKTKITNALRKGVEDALLKHKLLGKPIVVWEKGKAVWIAPEKIKIKTKRKS